MSDVSKKLDLVFDFMTGMQNQLLAIDSKLSALQSDVSAMRDDLRRLTGKPFLEVYSEWSTKTIKSQTSKFQHGVYIEPSVCGSGEKDDFMVSSENPSELISSMMKTFFEDHLKKKKKDAKDSAAVDQKTTAQAPDGASQGTTATAEPKADASAKDTPEVFKEVLLLSGPAGSGKSTAVTKLVHYVLTDYTQKRLVDGITVILLPISLPSLKDPLGSLFEEGALQAYDGALRRSQVDELRSLLQDSEKNKLELILLLDAYDELAPEVRFLSRFPSLRSSSNAVVLPRFIGATCTNLTTWSTFTPPNSCLRRVASSFLGQNR